MNLLEFTFWPKTLSQGHGQDHCSLSLRTRPPPLGHIISYRSHSTRILVSDWLFGTHSLKHRFFSQQCVGAYRWSRLMGGLGCRRVRALYQVGCRRRGAHNLVASITARRSVTSHPRDDLSANNRTQLFPADYRQRWSVGRNRTDDR